MKSLRGSLAALLILSIIAITSPAAAKSPDHAFKAQSAGGTLNVETGKAIRLVITSGKIVISKVTLVHENPNYESWVHKSDEVLIELDPTKVTGISYGSEAHHRIGTGVAVGLLSLGAGLIVASTKSTKHYIGITWDDNGNKGGIALEVEKGEYRGILAALQGVTGKQYVDTDSTVARKLGVVQ